MKPGWEVLKLLVSCQLSWRKIRCSLAPLAVDQPLYSGFHKQSPALNICHSSELPLLNNLVHNFISSDGDKRGRPSDLIKHPRHVKGIHNPTHASDEGLFLERSRPHRTACLRSREHRHRRQVQEQPGWDLIGTVEPLRRVA